MKVKGGSAIPVKLIITIEMLLCIIMIVPQAKSNNIRSLLNLI